MTHLIVVARTDPDYPGNSTQLSRKTGRKDLARLALGLTLVLPALTGCGGDSGGNPQAADPGPFEAEGKWLYLGPSDIPHTLSITRTSMVYTDVDGMWSSNWTIKAYDNGLHHFQVTFDTGVGAYLPVGQTMSGTYDLGTTLLTVQLASGDSYPPLQGAGTCTADVGGMPVPDCRLYVKQ